MGEANCVWANGYLQFQFINLSIFSSIVESRWDSNMPKSSSCLRSSGVKFKYILIPWTVWGLSDLAFSDSVSCIKSSIDEMECSSLRFLKYLRWIAHWPTGYSW